MPWWKDRLLKAVQFNIEDPYGFYADKIRAETLVALARKVHADVLIVFARDAWGRVFYEGSRLYPRHPTAALDVRELVEKAHERGIRVVVMAAHTANRYLYRLHPDWAQRNRDGEVIVLEHYPRAEKVRDPHWPQICPNSPALELFFVPEVEEAVAHTGADGLLLDSFRYLPDPPKACFCKHCRAKFRREYGYDLPVEVNIEDEAFREAWEWRYRVTVRALEQMREAVKRANPEALYFYNSHPAGWAGRGNVVVSKARDVLDAVFAEASETDVRGPGLLSIITKLSKALLGEGKPVFVSRNLFYDLRPVQSPPGATIRLGVYEIVAAGGLPIATIFSSQFFEDQRAIDHLAEAYEVVDRVRDYVEGSHPIRYIGILFDTDTHDKYYWNRPEYYIGEVEGFAFMAMHRHLPWGFISTQDLLGGIDLAGYPVIIAAGTSVLGEDEEEVLRNYVEEGGFLVVTHEFGLMRPDYTYREALALQDILGVKYEGTLWFGYSFLDLEDAIWEGLPKAIPLGDHSAAFVRERVEPKLGEVVRARPAGARVLAWTRMGRSAYGYEYTLGRSTPAPDSRLNLSGIAYRETGGGRTLYYSVRLGAHYSRLGHPDYAELFMRPLARFGPKPPLTVEAPETVQAEYYRKGDAYVIHLVNHTYNQRILSAPTGPSKQAPPSFDPTYRVHPIKEVIPVRGVRIRVNGEGDYTARGLVSGRDLRVSRGKDGILVELDEIREYEVVVVEPRG